MILDFSATVQKSIFIDPGYDVLAYSLQVVVFFSFMFRP